MTELDEAAADISEEAPRAKASEIRGLLADLAALPEPEQKQKAKLKAVLERALRNCEGGGINE
jgi:hypothetical protein